MREVIWWKCWILSLATGMLGRGVKHIAGPNPGDRAATTLLNSPFASSKTLSKYYFTLLGSLLRPFAQKHPAMDPHCPMLQTRQKSWVLLCSPSGSSMLCFFSLNCLQGSDNVWPLSTVQQQSDVVARLSEDRHCTENHHGEVATSCPRTCSLAIRSWPNPALPIGHVGDQLHWFWCCMKQLACILTAAIVKSSCWGSRKWNPNDQNPPNALPCCHIAEIARDCSVMAFYTFDLGDTWPKNFGHSQSRWNADVTPNHGRGSLQFQALHSWRCDVDLVRKWKMWKIVKAYIWKKHEYNKQV